MLCHVTSSDITVASYQSVNLYFGCVILLAAHTDLSVLFHPLLCVLPCGLNQVLCIIMLYVSEQFSLSPWFYSAL